MTKRLKVGVLGAGIGKLHIAAYRELPDLYSVEAIADIDRDKAAALAGNTGVSRTVASLDDLLSVDLDIVDICTPSALHFEHAAKVLAAGKHAIVEKPAASSLAEIDRLGEIERQSGRRLSPIFQYRFGGGFARFRHLAAAGLVGKPYVATVETHWRRTADYYRNNPWRSTWEGALGGCLVTHAIHAHDLLSQAFGPIASVYARMATRVNDVETEDCAAIVTEMESGALATLSVTLGCEEEISRLRFCFDGLTAESSLSPYSPAAMPWRFVASDETARRRIDEALADFPSAPERFAGQFAALHGAIVEGTALPVTLDDARASLELLTAAYRSAQTGEAAHLPIGPDHPYYQGWTPDAAARRR